MTIEAGVDAQAPERVLIVDDDPRIRTIFAAALRPYGVVVAETADAAADILVDHPHLRLVLCDMDLGTVSGRAVYEFVAEHRPDLRDCFVVMSGFLHPDEAAFMASHDVECFEKPGSLVSLREIAERYLGS
jgi:DNA-binding NtrC family response regulator